MCPCDPRPSPATVARPVAPAFPESQSPGAACLGPSSLLGRTRTHPPSLPPRSLAPLYAERKGGRFCMSPSSDQIGTGGRRRDDEHHVCSGQADLAASPGRQDTRARPSSWQREPRNSGPPRSGLNDAADSWIKYRLKSMKTYCVRLANLIP